MLTKFFYTVREAGIPVSLTEYLSLLEALDARVAEYSVDDFYYLARTAMVKDEKHFDRFDRAFAQHFKGVEKVFGGIEADIPAEWLRRVKVCLARLGPQIEASRMIKEYTTTYYEPAAQRSEQLEENHYERTKGLVRWKRHLFRACDEVAKTRAGCGPEAECSVHVEPRAVLCCGVCDLVEGIERAGVDLSRLRTDDRRPVARV